MTNFIDTHAHLYLPAFDQDRRQVIQNAIDGQVAAMFLPNIDLESVASVLALHAEFPAHCFPMLGLHPCDVKENYMELLDGVEKILRQPPVKIWGIGETGTDAYWDSTFIKSQIESFERQIHWAKEFHLPVIIHSRNTLDLNIEIISRYQDGHLRGIFHCFGGEVTQAKRIMDLNFLLGVGGSVTYKKSTLAEVIKAIGLSHVVLETDAPFLAPVPYRGKRNESKYIIEVAKAVAQQMGLSLEEVAHATSQNACTLFGLDGQWVT